MGFLKAFYDLYVDYLCRPENLKAMFIEDFAIHLNIAQVPCE